MTIRYIKRGKTVEQKADADAKVQEVVRGILADIDERRDAAVRELSQKFDNWNPDDFRLSPAQIEAVISSLPATSRLGYQIRAGAGAEFRPSAARRAARRRSRDAARRCAGPQEYPGQWRRAVTCPAGATPWWPQRIVQAWSRPRRPASIALSACTPPINGELPAATIAAMHFGGADEIYILGGVQALAAMAYGALGIEPVDMIVGPGNAYVAEAKRQLFGLVGIDLAGRPN